MGEDVGACPMSADMPVPVRYSEARRQVPLLALTVTSPRRGGGEGGGGGGGGGGFLGCGVHDLVPLTWAHHAATTTWVPLTSAGDSSAVVGWVVVSCWYQDPAPAAVGYVPRSPPPALVDAPVDGTPVPLESIGAHTAAGVVAVHLVAIRKIAQLRDGAPPGAPHRTRTTVWLRWGGRLVQRITGNATTPGVDGTVYKSVPEASLVTDAGVVLNQYCVVPWAPTAATGACVPPPPPPQLPVPACRCRHARTHAHNTHTRTHAHNTWEWRC